MHLRSRCFKLRNLISFLVAINKSVQFLAIDVDEKLISTAKEKFMTESNYVQFSTLNLMDTDDVTSMFEQYLNSLKKRHFDVIFCFSVTMWIHLNHGDAGLELFFKTARKWCKYLVLEPQPWKCYRTASRRMRRANQPEFEYLNKIKFQCDKLLPYIIELCEKNGFQMKYTFGETGWKRQIMLFETVI